MLRKKIAFSFLMAFVLIFGYFAAVFPVKAATPVIVINPGHLVGRDSGAVNNNTNIQEANLNAALAAMTAEKLKSIGYDVYLTHPVSGCSIPTLLTTQQVNAGYDANSSLKTIGDAINVKNPDLAISIHHNSGGNASGYEFYWSSYRAGIDSSGLYKEYGLWSNGDYAWKDSTPCESAQRSKDFSKLLEKNLDGIGLPFRNTIERDDYIPAHTVCPSVLIEAGFVSNDAESRKLADVNYQNEEANRIVNSINDFFGYKPEISVDSIVASNVSGDGFNVIVSGVKGYGVAAIFIPVWSEAQGQGSTIWHEAIRQSDGTYIAKIKTSEYKNNKGKYIILAYAMDTQSQLTGLGSTSVEVPASKEMTAESVTVSEVSSRSFKVNVKGVKAGQYGVAAIFIPVWSEAQGQGSTIWHEATRQS
ncbi:GBS Bsp-like repeat-containing protein, partial [Eubacterium limosum]|uniref:N-acetylmuramoyl-L-alanine amidase n=1 Tax=Eubacterium limosum TaxID=1736 RepID=UPI001D083074